MSELNCSTLYMVSFLVALIVADLFMPSVILTIGVIITIPLAIATLVFVFSYRQRYEKQCTESNQRL